MKHVIAGAINYWRNEIMQGGKLPERDNEWIRSAFNDPNIAKTAL